MPADCATLDRQLAAARKARNHTPILTKARKAADQKVKALAAARKRCRKAGKGKGSKGSSGKTPATIGGLTPEQLWSMDPTKRPIGVMGIVTGTLAGNEDTLVAIARGARTSFATRALDDRATIRGGLAALFAAGQGEVDPATLSSKVVQGKRQDQALVKAAGGGGSLKGAADKVRARVEQAGLARSAWGYRGLYVLDNLKGFNTARGVATTVVSLFFPIGTIVGAAMAAHGAITGQVAKSAAAEFQRLAASPPAAGRGSSSSNANLPAPVLPEAADSRVPWYAWAGGAVGLVALAFFARRRAAA